MSSSSTTTGSSLQSSEGSSATSDSYTTTSYSTVDPPSQLNCAPNCNHSTVSGISDPSAATSVSGASHFHTTHSTVPTMSVFSPVLEETSSALDEASSSFGGAGGGGTANLSNTGSTVVTTPPIVGTSATAATHVKTSVDADGVNIEITSSNPSTPLPSPAGPVLPLECDYDVNPTELYQAIETKKWEHIGTLFSREPIKTQKQAATWVTRKETNGKLRWRLLPIHAAVIFQSPASIVEKLLQECPEAAQAKDDQGMLPLHLAFRTKSTDWETIEELITSYPQGIFVKDRKGRTPLECGLAAATAAMSAETAKQVENQPSTVAHTSSLMGALAPKPQPLANNLSTARAITPTVQKAIFSVLEVYTQISVQDKLQSAMNTSRKALETKIGAVQDSHVATLTQLKNDWENQRSDLSRKIQGYRKEIQNLKSDFNIQQELLEEKVKTEMELVDKLQQVTTALEAKTVMDEEVAEEFARDLSNMHTENLKEANQKADALKKTNKELLLLLEMLLDQQNSLKLSLDKLSWEANSKNQERRELLNKCVVFHEESVKMTNSYTQEWQERLEATSIDVSTKLTTILGKQSQITPSDMDATIDDYDGEEKKDNHSSDPQVIQVSGCGSSPGATGKILKDP